MRTVVSHTDVNPDSETARLFNQYDIKQYIKKSLEDSGVIDPFNYRAARKSVGVSPEVLSMGISRVQANQDPIPPVRNRF